MSGIAKIGTSHTDRLTTNANNLLRNLVACMQNGVEIVLGRQRNLPEQQG